MKLRELMEKATPGTWEACPPEGRQPHWTIWAKGKRKWNTWVASMKCGEAPMEEGPNAALIVAAHNLLPELLAVREAAESYIDEVDNGLISGTHDRRAHMLHVTRAALAVLKEKEAKVCP